jgi:hypothetical protein
MLRKIDFILAAIHAASVATGNSEIENADSLRAAYNEQVNERGVDLVWERDFRPEVNTLRNITAKYWENTLKFNSKRFSNACKTAYKKVRADNNDTAFFIVDNMEIVLKSATRADFHDSFYDYRFYIFRAFWLNATSHAGAEMKNDPPFSDK